MSNTSVACPGEAVPFTCSKPATALRWQVDLPAEFGLTSVQSAIFLGSNVGRRDTFGSGVIMFEAVLVSSDGGTVTSTLINLSEVSVLDGSNVTCTSTVTDGGVIELQQTVIVAGKYLSNILLRQILNLQLLQPLHSTQDCLPLKIKSVRPLSLYYGILPPLLVVCLSAMSSSSPQHLSPGH